MGKSMNKKQQHEAGYIPLPVVTPASEHSWPVRKIPQPASPMIDSGPAKNGSEISGSADDATERDRLVEAMEKSGWVQAKAARVLGLSARQMGYALRKHNVEIKHF
jgi:Nif-specific regulatory protein